MDCWRFRVLAVPLEAVMPAQAEQGVLLTWPDICMQVDVRALKELLWHSTRFDQEHSHGRDVSFQDLIADVPSHSAAGKAEDLSVHLCFICLLHLANEHGLAISGTESLDQLVVSHPGS